MQSIVESATACTTMWCSLTFPQYFWEQMIHLSYFLYQAPDSPCCQCFFSTDRRTEEERQPQSWSIAHKKALPRWPETPTAVSSNPLTHTQPKDQWSVTEQRPLSLREVQFPILNRHFTAFIRNTSLCAPEVTKCLLDEQQTEIVSDFWTATLKALS